MTPFIIKTSNWAHKFISEVEDTHNRLAFLDAGVVLHVPLFYLEGTYLIYLSVLYMQPMELMASTWYIIMLFAISGVVLFPEATLPLRVIQPNFIAAVDRALRQEEAPYTIGVVCEY